MYFNDVHILYYVLFGVIGAVMGQVVHYCSKCFLKEEKILNKENFKKYIKTCKPVYILMSLTSIAYVFLLYKFGIHKSILQNIDLIKYLCLTPMLICVVIVDYKEQIIPNRLNLLMFELGLIFMFLYGFSNLNISMNMLLGMLAGGLVFLIITLLGGAIAGKEAMGLGDVKLMGALGLYFGLTNIIIISVLSFLIGAILSILLMIVKTKKVNEYIPFGPFIVIASIITMFVPFDILFNILMKIFTLGLY